MSVAALETFLHKALTVDDRDEVKVTFTEHGIQEISVRAKNCRPNGLVKNLWYSFYPAIAKRLIMACEIYLLSYDLEEERKKAEGLIVRFIERDHPII